MPPQFLALNPLGQIPVLQEGETIIADSNAILVYLALAYDSERRWLPVDPLHAARVQTLPRFSPMPLLPHPDGPVPRG